MRMTVIMTVSVKSDSDSEKSNMQNNINSLTKPRCNINSMQKISYFWSHSSKNQLSEFISACKKNQFTLFIPVWDSAKFRNSWPEWPDKD